MKNPLISIIIVDYKPNTQYLIQSLQAIDTQTYTNFETILIHDLPVKLPQYPWLKTKFLNQNTPPATKRDLGAELAQGQLLTFLDDDAYPDPNWLRSIVTAFTDPTIIAIGGPGITPPNVSFLESASGWASASPLGAGPYTYRFIPQSRRIVDDYPSMNLSVRKKDFLAVGGFDSHYWPGEDTKLCLDLTNLNHGKIIYDPKVIVFHHRRPLWLPHLRQNGNFGLHRGFFAKTLPQTSLRVSYFLPSFMIIGLAYLIFSSIFSSLQIPILYPLGQISLAIYVLALLTNALWILNQSQSLTQALISIPSVFLTQSWYGIRFLEGFLFKQKLTR